MTWKTVTQEQYDYLRSAATYMDKQGVRSISSDGDDYGCSYRGKDNTCCFVGALIPDESYKESMEGLKVSALYKKHGISACPEILKELMSEHMDLLADLQNFHDNSCRWEAALNQGNNTAFVDYLDSIVAVE